MWGSEAGRPDDRQWLLSLAMGKSNVWLWIVLKEWGEVWGTI